MRSKTLAIDTATHVVFDTATAQRLSAIGAANIVRASDRLVIGPSRRDPLEHERTREAWWRSPQGEKWDYLYSPEIRWQSPIVVWVSASIHERVNLWRTLTWLRHLGIQRRDVFILEFNQAPPSGVPDQP